MGRLFADSREREQIRVAPGAVWLKAWLPIEEQASLASRCRATLDGPAGGYVPTVRGGGKMRVRMTCLGRHWNPLTYKYEQVRADFDGKPVPELPPDLAALGRRLAATAGFDFNPDICL